MLIAKSRLSFLIQTGIFKRDNRGDYVQRSDKERVITQNTSMKRKEGSHKTSAENFSPLIEEFKN